MTEYQPHGAAKTFFEARDQELMLAGPADTGKSMAVLTKLHACMTKYPGARALIVRKTRHSLTDSALVTFEERVLPPGSRLKLGPKRDQRHSYRYPNGSEIVLGGLATADEVDRTYSQEYDLVYVQEAREILESEWEALRARCRWGRMPYWQIVGDTNPDAPRHWIKLRSNRGQLRLLESRHADNPTFTPERQAILEGLTGVRRKRLLDGLWVASEGIIYDGWDASVHVCDWFSVPGDWPRYLAIDFGYTNPFVCQWWAQDPDGRLLRYRELYQTQALVEDLAHTIREHSVGERIRAIVCDHDAEDRATLERHLTCRCDGRLELPVTCGTTPAKKDVSPGLQAVAQRLKAAGDGRPRLRLVRDGLIARDPHLDERKLPCSTEEEIEGYVWDTAVPKLNPDGSARKEEPLKLNDHGCDAMRYMVAYFDLRDPRADIMGTTVPLVQGSRPVRANSVPPRANLGGMFPEVKGFG
jgi:PBSX family phage terminase large subunit